VRPIFLHNDDRVEALVSVVGLALLVFGLIESELRRRLATSGCRALAGGSLRAPNGPQPSSPPSKVWELKEAAHTLTLLSRE
jgi:hypothetical protein